MNSDYPAGANGPDRMYVAVVLAGAAPLYEGVHSKQNGLRRCKGELAWYAAVSGSLLRVSSRAAEAKSVVRSTDLYQSDDQEISGGMLAAC